MEPRPRTDRQTLLLIVLLAATTPAVYWPVLRFGFINYDDPEYVTENANVQQGLTWEP